VCGRSAQRARVRHARRKGTALANALGRALQLTNILRDLDDDATRGRLYLPREALLAAGIERSDPGAVLGIRHSMPPARFSRSARAVISTRRIR
jgi:phytoene/squalene synthetase